MAFPPLRLLLALRAPGRWELLIWDIVIPLSLYGFVIATVLGTKHVLALKNPTPDGECSFTTAVIVPVYNEVPAALATCLGSVRDNRPTEVFVVFDGPQSPELMQVSRDAGYEPIVLPARRGKRAAQAEGFLRMTSELAVTVDSDTELEESGIKNIVKPFVDPRVGAVCGNISVVNETDNTLTRLLAVRYFNACNLDRAAQSYCGSVIVSTGVFSAYRASVIKPMSQEYVTQRWMGHECTYGDDRHLTAMVLRSGYRTVYQKSAMARTLAPTKLMVWLKQQLRWNRSFWRETVLMVPWAASRSKALATLSLVDAVLPFLYLFLGFIPLLILIVTSPIPLTIASLYVLSVSFIAFIRNFRYKKNLSFFIIPLYAFAYSSFLLPLSVYAALTTHKTGWLTR